MNLFLIVFLRAESALHTSQVLATQKKKKKAKLLRAHGLARAPVPAALYPAGLKIAAERSGARDDAEIGWISSVFGRTVTKPNTFVLCQRGDELCTAARAPTLPPPHLALIRKGNHS